MAAAPPDARDGLLTPLSVRGRDGRRNSFVFFSRCLARGRPGFCRCPVLGELGVFWGHWPSSKHTASETQVEESRCLRTWLQESHSSHLAAFLKLPRSARSAMGGGLGGLQPRRDSPLVGMETGSCMCCLSAVLSLLPSPPHMDACRSRAFCRNTRT